MIKPLQVLLMRPAYVDAPYAIGLRKLTRLRVSLTQSSYDTTPSTHIKGGLGRCSAGYERFPTKTKESKLLHPFFGDAMLGSYKYRKDNFNGFTIILYYTIIYYTILCYAMLCYAILYYTILYYTILYYTIRYYIPGWFSPL